MTSFVSRGLSKCRWALPSFSKTSINIRYFNISAIFQSSYIHRADLEPLSYCTLGDYVDIASDKFGDREALVSCHQNLRRTFAELKQDADEFATGLYELGLRRSDRMGIWGSNNYEWIVTQFAAAKLGAILVTINPAYQAYEMEYCLQKAGIQALVADEKFKNQDYYQVLCKVIPDLPEQTTGEIHCKTLPKLRHIIMLSDKTFAGTRSFTEMLFLGASGDINKMKSLQTKVQAEEPLHIMFTSGTTGHPKGAVLTHHGLINNAYFLGKRMEYHLTPDKICVVPPLFHAYGVIGGPLVTTLFGLTSVYPSPMFSAKHILEAIQQEKCTVLLGTPTMHIGLINHPDFRSYDLSSLQKVTTAGSSCPPEVCQEICKKLTPNLTVAYGTTECSPCISVTEPNDDFEKRSRTVGTAMEHIEVKLVDIDNRVVPSGETGEVWVRGYNVMLGYWDELEKTREVITSDGWYKTGDIARMDKNGYISIVSRKSHVIIRGGENVYPQEIEDFLHTHPDIEENQIIGVPDRYYGEEICVWIKVKKDKTLTEENVREYCKGQIANYKIPRYIVFVNDFPRTESGKIQKFKMYKSSLEILRISEKKDEFYRHQYSSPASQSVKA